MQNELLKDYIDFDISINNIGLVVSKACPKNWELEMKERAMYGLLYIVSGAAFFEYADASFATQRGDVVLLEKNSSYKTTATSSEQYVYILVSFDIEEQAVNFPFKHVIGSFEDLYGEFKLMEDVWFSKGLCYKIYVRSILNGLLFDIVRRTVERQEFSNTSYINIRATVDYMRDYFDKKISLETLAAISGYSVSYYRKQFRSIYGEPPLDYLNRLRIERAKDLLAGRVYNCSEVAELCGFSNVYYFSRMFKKIVGYSPKKHN